ncbi:hypothetical protein PVAP13_5NG461100 [Panicum virgatum]|uniref:Uncharacterized protein n=1 Tax=Panicum virgatum TaxID=38727 RepID=A0A8T0S202_PANVG|nr:hypothetical protein PVAP13_5NG461100 [Panicum virgatum]
MAVKEFELLALDGHNYPTWAVDIKVSLASRGLYQAVLPLQEGVAPLDDQHVYTALYIIRSHIHPDLKAEYSDLIHTLLEAEKHSELMVWNNQQRPVGSTPLPEVHENSKKGKKNRRSNKKFQNRVSNKGKNISKHRSDKPVCQKCGCYSHITKKCRTPSHLVDLYLKSVGRGRATQGQKYEAHFNYRPDTTREEASCSQQVPEEPSNNPIPGGEDLATKNMIVEYASNDIFGDLE